MVDCATLVLCAGVGVTVTLPDVAPCQSPTVMTSRTMPEARKRLP